MRSQLLALENSQTGEWRLGNGDWGLGTGDWGLGTGDWGLGNGEWGMGNGGKENNLCLMTND
ncbi:MAG: hypothetical protein V7K50_27145 [Nostoc sp.]|uniref:hypothetical protein n=1 Tax=Nostoc sp. TaxID=1180 RepID=UPI002FF9694E